MQELILKELLAMSKEARGFRGRRIPTWTPPLSSNDVFFASRSPAFWETCLDFHRTFVSCSQPVVIKGAFGHWAALALWRDDDHLRSKLAGKPISVAATPNGRADAVDGGAFCTPCTLRMPVGELLERLCSDSGPVLYCQQQNDNFRDEFAELHADVEPDGVELFNRAFGVPPEACNIWIGDSRSTTTAHRDHYENIVCVLRGRKTFHLVAPSDAWRLRQRTVPCAAYVFDEQQQTMRLQPAADAPHVPWIVDPVESMPQAKWGPLRVTLEPGDALYLPSLWIHAVTQEPGDVCINLNFWYDMQYSMHYAMQHTIGRLGQILQDASSS